MGAAGERDVRSAAATPSTASNVSAAAAAATAAIRFALVRGARKTSRSVRNGAETCEAATTIKTGAASRFFP